MDHQNIKAADKLASNICENLSGEEAADFAAYLTAQVAVKLNLHLGAMINGILQNFGQLIMGNTPSGTSQLQVGNCTCNARCFIRQESSGPIVIHSGMACPGFKTKFSDSRPGATRAKDEFMWDNFSPPEPEPSRPSDDARDRFSLLEFT